MFLERACRGRQLTPSLRLEGCGVHGGQDADDGNNIQHLEEY